MPRVSVTGDAIGYGAASVCDGRILLKKPDFERDRQFSERYSANKNFK
jgi:hypothetical protein